MGTLVLEPFSDSAFRLEVRKMAIQTRSGHPKPENETPRPMICSTHVSLRNSLGMDFCTPKRNLCVNSSPVKKQRVREFEANSRGLRT